MEVIKQVATCHFSTLLFMPFGMQNLVNGELYCKWLGDICKNREWYADG
jgi:hypothetical protein